MSRIFSALLFVFIVTSVLSAGYLWNYFFLSSSLKQDTVVVIEQGSSLSKISHSLGSNSVISTPIIFKAIVRFTNPSGLQAGEYNFEAGITPINVYNKLASGDTVAHKLTIAEGLMTSQALEIVASEPMLKGDITIKANEGALLPETYNFSRGDSKDELVKRMQDSMKNAIDELWEQRADDLVVKNKKEALVLASIVEKETGVPEERARVAAVFINRLKKGMRLQSDPTTIYAITKGKYVLERPLRFKDLEIISPYNTYYKYGLPPSPIGNPGIDAIKAVLNPLKTDEYYFVADGSGGHKFARTLEEHNRNVRNWRKINRRK